MINVITKRAQQTKGGQVAASAGNETRNLETRWGAGISFDLSTIEVFGLAIFDAFTQADGSHRRQFGGTGLGADDYAPPGPAHGRQALGRERTRAGQPFRFRTGAGRHRRA